MTPSVAQMTTIYFVSQGVYMCVRISSEIHLRWTLMDSFHKSVMMRCCHLSSASLVVKHPKMGK